MVFEELPLEDYFPRRIWGLHPKPGRSSQWLRWPIGRNPLPGGGRWVVILMNIVSLVVVTGCCYSIVSHGIDTPSHFKLMWHPSLTVAAWVTGTVTRKVRVTVTGTVTEIQVQVELFEQFYGQYRTQYCIQHDNIIETIYYMNCWNRYYNTGQYSTIHNNIYHQYCYILYKINNIQQYITIHDNI